MTDERGRPPVIQAPPRPPRAAAPPAPKSRRRPVDLRADLLADEDAVSPVVGTVLLIAVMLLTVSALMLWGVPALQDLQRNSQYRSLLSAFTVLDGVVDEVLPETGSSRQARIPLARGDLVASTGDEPFAVAWSPGAHEITYGDLGDNDEDVTFSVDAGGASVDDCVFTHYNEDGTLQGTYTVAPSGGTCTADIDLNTTHRLELDDGGTVVGTLWLFHAGKVRYTADNPQGPFNMDYVNGAIVTDASGQTRPAVVNDPLVLKLDPDGLTVGLIDLNGTGGSAGGDSVVRVQVTLDGTFVRTDSTTVERADIYPLGDLGDGWTRFFNTSQRYEFEHVSGDDHVRYEPGGDFSFTLTHFVVDIEVLGASG